MISAKRKVYFVKIEEFKIKSEEGQIYDKTSEEKF